MPVYKTTFRTCRLVRERTVRYHAASDRVYSEDAAVQIVRSLTRNSPTEWLIALYLNAHHELLGCSVIARGGKSECSVTPADIFRAAILHNASALVIAHNHPSGKAIPSEADWQFARQVYAAGETLRIQLLDSLVVTDREHFSMGACKELGEW